MEEELIYYYAVTAIDSVGNESEPSVNATLIYDITPPVSALTPGGTLYYDDAGNSYAGLSYTYSLAATDNLDETFLRYEVHVSTEANFSLSEDTKVAEITEQATTSYTVTGLSSLSTYYAKVTVVFTDETRIESNETSADTRADIIIEYTYDENSNRVEMKETKWPDTYVTSYEYDPLNRLRKVTDRLDKAIYYEYDSNGNRVSKADASGTINYINDINLPLVQVLMEEDEGGNVLASYTIGNDLISRHSPATAQTPAQTEWYHYDGLGNVRQLTDSVASVVADYVYDAWGNLLGSTDEISNVYGFTGEQQFGEGDGLVFLRARYYDAGIGRFISVDLVEFLSRYVYVGNNRVR